MERIWINNYEPAVPVSIEYPPTTLPQMLTRTRERFPDHTALIFQGQGITFRELHRAATAFAAALADLGLEKGDRVAVHLPNLPSFVIAYYGTLMAGGIVVPTNPLYVERELEHQFNNSGARFVVTLPRFYPVIKKVQPRTGVEKVIVSRIKDYLSPLMGFLYTLLKEKKEGDRIQLLPGSGDLWLADLVTEYSGKPAPPVEVDWEEIAVLMYTGGTTGVSKGASLTHKNLFCNAVMVSKWVTDWEEGKDVGLGALPFFHSYGMTCVLNSCILMGSSIVLIPRFAPQEVLKLIQEHKATLFPGVPTMYVALLNHPDIKKYDLTSIKACISGGAPLPVEVCTRFEEVANCRLVEGYGLSESSPVTHANPIYGRRKIGSIGIPYPDTDCKIVDLDTGEELPVGETGELCIKGPQVMSGYWNMPEETEFTLKDGWLYTGDIARVDDEGYFFIVDRKKDMVIAGGYNIFPRDIEEVLYSHPKVMEAVVAGVPDAYRGETIKAYIVPKEGSDVSAEEIISFCKQNLAAYKVPKKVEFRSELPKTMVGKILRRVLVEEEKKKLEQQRK